VLGPLSVKKNEERKKEVASLLADIVKYIEKGRLTSVTFRDLPEKGPLPSSEESITFEESLICLVEVIKTVSADGCVPERQRSAVELDGRSPIHLHWIFSVLENETGARCDRFGRRMLSQK